MKLKTGTRRFLQDLGRMLKIREVYMTSFSKGQNFGALVNYDGVETLVYDDLNKLPGRFDGYKYKTEVSTLNKEIPNDVDALAIHLDDNEPVIVIPTDDEDKVSMPEGTYCQLEFIRGLTIKYGMLFEEGYYGQLDLTRRDAETENLATEFSSEVMIA